MKKPKFYFNKISKKINLNLFIAIIPHLNSHYHINTINKYVESKPKNIPNFFFSLYLKNKLIYFSSLFHLLFFETHKQIRKTDFVFSFNSFFEKLGQ